MNYREWKSLSNICGNRKVGSPDGKKMKSRGSKAYICDLTNRDCKMSGCPKKTE